MAEEPREQAPPGPFDPDAHSRALMLRRRCGRCAERVAASELLRAGNCPRCGGQLGWPCAADTESIIEAIDRRWRRRRWPVYIFVTVTAALTGFVPLLPTIVSVAVMIYLRLAILREPVSWFGPGRRILAKVGLKLWLVTVGCINLALISAAALVPFVNVVLSGVVSVATSALFVEVALVYLRGRLRQEAEAGPRLEAWEWGVPLALVAGMAAAAAGSALAIAGIWQWVTGLFG